MKFADCTRRTTILLSMVATLGFGTPAVAQSPDAAPEPTADWETSLGGLGAQLLEERQGLGVLLATPADSSESAAVASLIERQLIESGIAEVVMDDRVLGSLEGLSDDEIIARAADYPVDVVVVLRTFPGAGGPTVVMRVEMTDRGSRSFRLRPGKPTSWKRRSTAELSQEDGRDEQHDTKQDGDIALLSNDRATAIRQSAVSLTETVRLVEAEASRRFLTVEPLGNFARVVDVEGDEVEWPVVYDRIGGEDLERAWRSRRTVRTAAFVSGGVLGAVGAGLLYVSLTNSTNCGPEDPETCASPAMTGLGALSMSVGAIAIFTGLLVSPHPVTVDELDERVDRFNDQLSNR